MRQILIILVIAVTGCATTGAGTMSATSGENSVRGVTNDPIGASAQISDNNARDTQARIDAENAEHCRSMERRGRQSSLCPNWGGSAGGGGNLYLEDFRNLQPAPAPAAMPQNQPSADPDQQPATKADVKKVEEKTDDLIREKIREDLKKGQ